MPVASALTVSRVLLDGAVGGHVRDDNHGEVLFLGTEVLEHAVLGVGHVHVQELAAVLLRHLQLEKKNKEKKREKCKFWT